jgi:hypothetical protein
VAEKWAALSGDERQEPHCFPRSGSCLLYLSTGLDGTPDTVAGQDAPRSFVRLPLARRWRACTASSPRAARNFIAQRGAQPCDYYQHGPSGPHPCRILGPAANLVHSDMGGRHTYWPSASTPTYVGLNGLRQKPARTIRMLEHGHWPGLATFLALGLSCARFHL